MDTVLIRGEWHTVSTCCHDKCGVIFTLSPAINSVAEERREKFSFYCPNGHEQWFVTGDSDQTIMRRKIERLEQNKAYLNDCINEERTEKEHAQAKARGYKGYATKLSNRARAGVCPCCNRSFKNLAAHMDTKHPKFDGQKELEEAHG